MTQILENDVKTYKVKLTLEDIVKSLQQDQYYHVVEGFKPNQLIMRWWIEKREIWLEVAETNEEAGSYPHPGSTIPEEFVYWHHEEPEEIVKLALTFLTQQKAKEILDDNKL